MFCKKKILAERCSFAIVALYLTIAGSARAQAPDIALVSMRPVQGVFGVTPLVRDKRTVLELQITSTFSSDVQVQVSINTDDPTGARTMQTSQKRARTSAESTSSLDLPCPAPKVATRRTQRRTSRSPRIERACRTE